MILAPRTVTEPRALRKKFVVDCSPSKTSTLKINRLISELMESGLDIRIGSVIREKIALLFCLLLDMSMTKTGEHTL